MVTVLLALLLATAPASAQEGGVIHQRLGAVIEPTGVEHMLAVGMRAPIGDPHEPLFEGAHLEVGAIDYTSPIDTRNGAYLEVVPLAFLVLRAEVTSIAMWSLGMDGAGFFPVSGDGADVRAQSLPGANGGRATGWNVRLGATVQGAVRLGPVRPIVWSQLTLEHEVLGDAPYHYSPRSDLVLRRDDWMLVSSTMVFLEVALDAHVGLRIGAFDEARWIPRSGALANQVGPAVALAIERPDPAVEEIMLLVRAGTFTDHATRVGQWSALAALIVRYAL